MTGKTIRWTFDDGPMPGTTFEHVLDADGTVTWRILDGQYKGATAREKAYAAVRVNEQTWAVSYLAASGHTLTVILSLADHRALGFASDGTTWSSFAGTFEVLN